MTIFIRNSIVNKNHCVRCRESSKYRIQEADLQEKVDDDNEVEKFIYASGSKS